MPSQSVSRVRVGEEREPLAIIENFAGDPEALRAAAAITPFAPAGQHYPGIRASLPSGYLAAQLPLIANIVMREFGRCRRVHVVDASFSIVTRPADEIEVRQRLPHVDAYGRERIALVHYLSLDDGDGTAFFRHRSTGFETVDHARAPSYFSCLEQELRDAVEPPSGYIAGDTTLFERTALVAARFNRALLYRSYVLHSGAISPNAALAADPLSGRLTVTGFFAID
ncbi:DUF6445 family protein [uncultured Sphingomonas sp.]|uniref:DUF6445 family protein n=1 Tax=uncultured Sphingomonas sp. TaxID=158754 RepID=UPI0035CB2D49